MITTIAEQKKCSAIEEIIWKPLYSDRRHTQCVGSLFFRVTYVGSLLRDGPLEKLWVGAGVGNFRAAGSFFRYQIPCMNFFRP